LPGPEAAVFNQRGFRHGFISKHQHHFPGRSEEPEQSWRRLSTSMNRLSSGLKINSAKDDAAGMQIANRLTTR
jgi:hypothetical protein